MKKASANGFWERCKTMLRDNFEKFEEYQESPLPKTIRVNTLRNSVSEFLDWAKKNHPDWELEPHPFAPEVFLIDRKDRSVPLGKSLGHIMGRFYIQEASSCIPPRALFLGNIGGSEISKGASTLVQDGDSQETILDMAAAPGSKTTQIAALMEEKGLLIANEYSSSRTKILVYNLQKNGVPNSVLTHFSGEKFGEAVPEFFDRILLDAPCTGEGTYRKDKQALEKWSEKQILSAAKLQKSLILSAFQALKPGGTLVYSTCTLAPEENEAAVDFLARSFPEEVEILPLNTLFPGAEKAPGLSEYEGKKFTGGEKSLRVWPHLFNSEGFFVAAVRKNVNPRVNSGVNVRRRSKKRKKHIDMVSRNKREYISTLLLDEYGISLPETFRIFQKKNELWACDERAYEIFFQMRPDRPGILVGKMFDEDLRISHEFALAFGKEASGEKVIELSEEEAKEYLSGQNLSLESEDNDPRLQKNESLPLGDMIVRYEGIPLGLVKNTGKILKNNISRNFVVNRIE